MTTLKLCIKQCGEIEEKKEEFRISSPKTGINKLIFIGWNIVLELRIKANVSAIKLN